MQQWFMESKAKKNGKQHHINADGKNDFQRRQPDFPDGRSFSRNFFPGNRTGNGGHGVRDSFWCGDLARLAGFVKKEHHRKVETEDKAIPGRTGISGLWPYVAQKKHGADKRTQRKEKFCCLFGKKILLIIMRNKNRPHGKAGNQTKEKNAGRQSQPMMTGKRSFCCGKKHFRNTTVNPEF